MACITVFLRKAGNKRHLGVMTYTPHPTSDDADSQIYCHECHASAAPEIAGLFQPGLIGFWSVLADPRA